jgi:hypothetical protein
MASDQTDPSVTDLAQSVASVCGCRNRPRPVEHWRPHPYREMRPIRPDGQSWNAVRDLGASVPSILGIARCSVGARTRTEGSVSIQKLPSGRWRAQVWDTRASKNVSVSKILGGEGTFRTKTEAKAACSSHGQRKCLTCHRERERIPVKLLRKQAKMAELILSPRYIWRKPQGAAENRRNRATAHPQPVQSSIDGHQRFRGSFSFPPTDRTRGCCGTAHAGVRA